MRRTKREAIGSRVLQPDFALSVSADGNLAGRVAGDGRELIMSETKPEIPAPMLDAAFDKWFAANEGPLLSAQATDNAIAYTAWNAALEAAGVAKMAADRERIGMALFQNGYDSGWTTDSAVEAIEAMAARIAELEAMLNRYTTTRSTKQAVGC